MAPVVAIYEQVLIARTSDLALRGLQINMLLHIFKDHLQWKSEGGLRKIGTTVTTLIVKHHKLAASVVLVTAVLGAVWFVE